MWSVGDCWMKKYGVLNSEIVVVFVLFGYIDMVVIVDCGLLIFDGVKWIDLVVEIGKLSFLEVL